MDEILLRDHQTFISVKPIFKGGGCRIELVEPPMIGDDPISHAPGQAVWLSESGAKKLYEALRSVYESTEAGA